MNAWVVLVMKGDSYIAGAMVTAHSIRKTQTMYHIVCMVTPDVSERGRKQLGLVFDHVIEVEYIETECKKLVTESQQQLYQTWVGQACTKWRSLGLTQYQKVCLIDADKIFLKNCDSIFDVQAPAGTFSSAWVIGKHDPFINTNMEHGKKIDHRLVQKGLFGFNMEDKGKQKRVPGYVCVGTMVLLNTSEADLKEFMTMLKIHSPFGMYSHSMVDEQSIVYFYFSKRIHWNFIHQRYNFIPWKLKWLEKGDKPYVYHFFGKKIWMKGYDNGEFPDMDVWRQLAVDMITTVSEENKSLMKEPFMDVMLTLGCPNQCSWCASQHMETNTHTLLDDSCKVLCPYF